MAEGLNGKRIEIIEPGDGSVQFLIEDPSDARELGRIMKGVKIGNSPTYRELRAEATENLREEPPVVIYDSHGEVISSK